MDIHDGVYFMDMLDVGSCELWLCACRVVLCRCAGVCSYEGRGGLCSVRLSVPLLKLRPRKDLVETLLVYAGISLQIYTSLYYILIIHFFLSVARDDSCAPLCHRA